MCYINVKTEKQTQEKRVVPFLLLADTVDLVKILPFPVTQERSFAWNIEPDSEFRIM